MQRTYYASIAIDALRVAPPHLQMDHGDADAYNNPISLYLNQATGYSWSCTNMTLVVEAPVDEDEEGVVLACFGPNEWWSEGEADPACDMAQIPWLRGVLQASATRFV
jgi:hypothetical protein